MTIEYKKNNLKIKVLLFMIVLLVFPSTAKFYCQSITPLKLVFSKICAGRNFNEFEVSFNHIGFPTGTTFEVQLSDSLGNFANPVSTTIISSTNVSVTQKKILFSIPSTIINSDNYKLRVKSSTGNVSTSFLNNNSNSTIPVFYKNYENSFFINKKESNAFLCNGGSINLSVYNPTPDFKTTSPANYPEIKYKWYKDNILISGATSSTLIVNSPGVYYAELDYGLCSDSNFSSNRVTVSASNVISSSIKSSLGNPFCSVNKTVLSTEKATSYQWYKDNIAIVEATNQTYETNQAGNYSVIVNFGGCETKASLNLQEMTLKGTLNVSNSIKINNGKTKNIQVNVVASPTVTPIFSWYRNDTEIIEAVSDNYSVSDEGFYKIKLSHPTCQIKDELLFEVNFLDEINSTEIPNLITPNNDDINDTWYVPSIYADGNDVEIQLLNSNGEEVFKTKNYLNNWPENVSDIKSNFSIYYYIISPPNQPTKRGIITVLK